MNSLLIPVRPHVLKYLEFHQGECYFLSESDPFGLFLFHLLRHPLTNARHDHVLTDYQGRWHVGLGSYGGSKWGLKEPTSNSVFQFNSFVHELVLKELHGWVELAIDHRQQAKLAIEGFMGKYGFVEEDIQFETLKRSWQRYYADRKGSKKKVVSLTGRHHLKQMRKELGGLPAAASRAA